MKTKCNLIAYDGNYLLDDGKTPAAKFLVKNNFEPVLEETDYVFYLCTVAIEPATAFELAKLYMKNKKIAVLVGSDATEIEPFVKDICDCGIYNIWTGEEVEK